MYGGEIVIALNLPDNLPDEASPGDWLGLRSQADLNSPINDSSLCSLSKWFLKCSAMTSKQCRCQACSMC